MLLVWTDQKQTELFADMNLPFNIRQNFHHEHTQWLDILSNAENGCLHTSMRDRFQKGPDKTVLPWWGVNKSF